MLGSFRLTMIWLHTWFGLVLGFGLMIAACYAPAARKRAPTKRTSKGLCAIWGSAAAVTLWLAACSGSTSRDRDAASREPTFENLLSVTCAWAHECQCWPESSRTTCHDWVGRDLALLQELASAQGWTFNPDCIQTELNTFEELGCRANLSNEALEELLGSLGCKYYSGSAAEGERCTISFDCAGNNYCNTEEGVCVSPSTVGTEGGECLPLEQGCAAHGTLWCDTREPAPGICRAVGGAGDTCLIDAPAADGTPGLLFTSCTSDNYCEEASRLCKPAPKAGEPCAEAYRFARRQCAPDHTCRADGLCYRTANRDEPNTEGGAISCNFSDEPNIPGLLDYRTPMPLSRRDLAVLVRDGYEPTD